MIPPEYLDLPLSHLLGFDVDTTQPVPVTALVTGLRRLNQQLAAAARARDVEQRAWLREQIERAFQ